MSLKELSYYLEKVDRYFEGQGSLEEIEQLLAAVNDDPELLAEVKLHIESRATIRHFAEDQLKAKFIAKLNEENLDERPKKRRNFLLLAVLLLLAALAAYFIVLKTQTATVPQLAEIEDPSFTNIRSDQALKAHLEWKECLASFMKKDYKATIERLISLEEDSLFVQKNEGKYNLLLGTALLKMSEYKSAIKTLKMVSQENPYYDQATWYLALSYYYSGEASSAKRLFEQISSLNSNFKSEEAKLFLSSIE